MNLERGPSSFNLFFRNHHVCGSLQKLGICQVLFGCVDLSEPWQLQTVSLQMVGWEPKSFPYFRDVQSGFFHGASAVGYFAASALTRNSTKNAWAKLASSKREIQLLIRGATRRSCGNWTNCLPFCCMSCSHVVSCSPVLCVGRCLLISLREKHIKYRWKVGTNIKLKTKKRYSTLEIQHRTPQNRFMPLQKRCFSFKKQNILRCLLTTNKMQKKTKRDFIKGVFVKKDWL